MSKEKNVSGNVQEDQRDRKMSKGELVSYGLGGVASTMPSQFKTAYAMNFMSDVAGLHVGAVGILNTLLIIWDAINDPIIGGIADRTNTKRWGKYRPHMIMGILLWAVIMVMLFTVPDLPETGMWIYYIVALLLYSVFYTQFTVPWQALNSAMTRDPQERESDAHLPSVRRLHRRSRCGRDHHSHCTEIGRSQNWMAHQRGDRLCHHDHHRPLCGQRSQAGGLL